MKLTRRGELVVRLIVAAVVVAFLAACAFVPPGWWLA